MRDLGDFKLLLYDHSRHGGSDATQHARGLGRHTARRRSSAAWSALERAAQAAPRPRWRPSGARHRGRRRADRPARSAGARGVRTRDRDLARPRRLPDRGARDGRATSTDRVDRRDRRSDLARARDAGLPDRRRTSAERRARPARHGISRSLPRADRQNARRARRGTCQALATGRDGVAHPARNPPNTVAGPCFQKHSGCAKPAAASRSSSTLSGR